MLDVILGKFVPGLQKLAVLRAMVSQPVENWLFPGVLTPHRVLLSHSFYLFMLLKEMRQSHDIL